MAVNPRDVPGSNSPIWNYVDRTKFEEYTAVPGGPTDAQKSHSTSAACTSP